MAVMSDVDHKSGWLARLAYRMVGEPQRSATDGYSVPGNDWPAVELDMSVEEVNRALKAIDEHTVARAQEEVPDGPSGMSSGGNA